MSSSIAWTLNVVEAEPAGIVMAAGTKILFGVLVLRLTVGGLGVGAGCG